MAKRVAIVQSNYIPWKGYFDLINLADEFILYDDLQYTRRDWRNRNLIKTPTGPQWLTIPVEVKGRYHQLIKDVRISEPNWNIRHWKTIMFNYGGAKYFADYKDFIQDLYLGCEESYLSQINFRFLRAICELLGIKTKLGWSTDYNARQGKTERLLDICKEAGASSYLSGPSAQGYLEVQLFTEANIAVEWMDYSGYPEYQQLYPPFDHAVSMIDLILNEGPDARNFMKSF